MNKLIVNNQSDNFFNHINKLLKECNSFIFNVAFMSFSGVQLLLDTFKELERNEVKGKILTSTYLNFTETKALEKVKEFNNIELKIYDSSFHNKGFHCKSYIFEFDEEYKVLLGSSNITASAFKRNIEWNIQTFNKKNDLFLIEVLNEFEILWNYSFYVTTDFLEKYDSFKKNIKQNELEFKYTKTIKANIMQKEALFSLEALRKANENKALVIAATGSGKSYLAAFDVQVVKPKRLLFLVHRENILIKAKKSFEEIISSDITCGLYTGNIKELDKDYLFSTIQTMALNYNKFDINCFDYIIVDEAHHIVSPSYKKVLDYFNPKFILGLTATSNRMDGESVYDSFDGNIACDIRLNDALDNDLIAPFHYYGLSDIETIDYSNIDISDISTLSKILSINKRVDFIIDKLNFYSFSGEYRKVIGFCVSKEHCLYMSNEFNKRGIVSTYLTSESSILLREEKINQLESNNDDLEVIFTVDIFNEGIDIPSINTVLMLRPTNSPIIFTQQLGRGLRKYKTKDFLTVLDFIGNHTKAYLIVLAMLGNKAIDKDSIKLSIENNFSNMPNAFIKMDEISKNRILEQINSQNFNQIKYLNEQYFEFKSLLGNKIPKLVDYIHYDDLINPLIFVYDSKSYIEFILKVEKNISFMENENNGLFIKAIRFIEFLLPIKRIYEFVILKYLLNNDFINEEILVNLLNKYLEKINKNTISHSFNFLNQDYLDKAQVNRYLKLIEFKNNVVKKTKEFEILCENKKYKEIFEDSLSYGILDYQKKFLRSDYAMPFLKLYEKYNMLNIAQLCNFNKIHSSFRGSGFLKYKDDFFLFINIEKEKFSKAANYKNTFISKDTFTYASKPSMSQDKGDGEKLIDNQRYGVKLHIFVRKFAQVDKKTQAFIYLGLANTITYKENKPILLELKLEKVLDNNLYEEFTKVIN